MIGILVQYFTNNFTNDRTHHSLWGILTLLRLGWWWGLSGLSLLLVKSKCTRQMHWPPNVFSLLSASVLRYTILVEIDVLIDELLHLSTGGEVSGKDGARIEPSFQAFVSVEFENSLRTSRKPLSCQGLPGWMWMDELIPTRQGRSNTKHIRLVLCLSNPILSSSWRTFSIIAQFSVSG